MDAFVADGGGDRVDYISVSKTSSITRASGVNAQCMLRPLCLFPNSYMHFLKSRARIHTAWVPVGFAAGLGAGVANTAAAAVFAAGA